MRTLCLSLGVLLLGGVSTAQAEEMSCSQKHTQFRNKVGLVVRLEAKPGKEAELEAFLKDGFYTIIREAKATTWFSFKTGPSSYGIFNTFQNDAHRKDHLSGQLAQELFEKASELLSEAPKVEPFEVLRAKVH